MNPPGKSFQKNCHCGAYDRDRTDDLVLTKDVLYLLSYVGPKIKCAPSAICRERETGFEPAALSLEG